MKASLAKIIRYGVLSAGLLFASHLQASFITVTNPGFDATANQNYTYNGTNYFVGNPIPNGLYVNTLDATSTGTVKMQSDDSALSPTVTATVNGWTALNTIGSVEHARAGVANYGPGDVAFLVTYNSVSGAGTNVGFSQTLPGSIQLQPHFTYTLSMALYSLSIPLSQSFFADLTVGGTPLGGTLVYNPPPNDNTPGSATVTYIAGNSPPAGNLGIIFSATDTSGSVRKILVDNITLDAVIPEPSTALLLGVGGLLMWGKRSRTP